MSDPEKIMKVLVIIAIVLIAMIMGLVLIYFILKAQKTKKQEEKELGIKDESKNNTQAYNINSIFDFMEFERIEDNMIIEKNGKYLMVLECQGVNYDLMSEMERTSIEQGFIEFLNTLRTEIQIYVQTRTVNLEDSLLLYRSKFKDIEEKFFEIQQKYEEMKDSDEYTSKEIQNVYLEYIKQKNKYEYTKDIIEDTEKNSLNSHVLHKKYYIIIPAYEDELITENYSKDEIQSMVFSELYTKARSIARTLLRCEISAKILDSEGLIDLLYCAYNRDESDVLGSKRALRAGFEDIYSTAPDVFDRKLKLLDNKIEAEAIKVATDAINEARSDKELLLQVREQNLESLIYDFAETLIDENEPYIGDDIASQAKAKVRGKKKQLEEGGQKDAKEKKTRTRKSTSSK